MEQIKKAATGYRETMKVSINLADCLKIRASLKEDVSPEGQAMWNNKPGTSNLLSLSGICCHESRSIWLN